MYLLAFPPRGLKTIPVSNGSAYPVQRIFCIGRNYAAHAREMGADPERDPPFFFTKWGEAAVYCGAAIPAPGASIAYPPETRDYHYEAELVVAIGKGGRNIAPAQAGGHIFGYACGLDMTRRDLQAEAKAKGRPWDVAKNVEQSAPVGLIHLAAECGPMTEGLISLRRNGEVRQSGDLSDMIWPVDEVVAYISRFYRLEPGDLIFTGTPDGVGPVVPGDTIIVSIAGLSDLVVTMAPPERD
ncbi:MAG: fumarylacetoacetate hydrolase family protein, partial [Asticcacaulis sp.]